MTFFSKIWCSRFTSQIRPLRPGKRLARLLGIYLPSRAPSWPRWRINRTLLTPRDNSWKTQRFLANLLQAHIHFHGKFEKNDMSIYSAAYCCGNNSPCCSSLDIANSWGHFLHFFRMGVLQIFWFETDTNWMVYTAISVPALGRRDPSDSSIKRSIWDVLAGMLVFHRITYRYSAGSALLFVDILAIDSALAAEIVHVMLNKIIIFTQGSSLQRPCRGKGLFVLDTCWVSLIVRPCPQTGAINWGNHYFTGVYFINEFNRWTSFGQVGLDEGSSSMRMILSYSDASFYDVSANELWPFTWSVRTCKEIGLQFCTIPILCCTDVTRYIAFALAHFLGSSWAFVSQTLPPSFAIPSFRGQYMRRYYRTNNAP